ncbi:MAG: hypothetical protein K2N56_13265 [Oscillospiraceae bacterium]|nr:hypothetical protein [Oscillospiraceae bacterium]
MKQQSYKEQFINAALVFIGNPLVFFCALPMLIIRPSLLAALTEIAVLAAHSAGSVRSCRRLEQKYGIKPERFILYSAVPAFLLDIVLVFASRMLFSDILPLIITYVFGGYSLIYTSILAVSVIKNENDRA